MPTNNTVWGVSICGEFVETRNMKKVNVRTSETTDIGKDVRRTMIEIGLIRRLGGESNQEIVSCRAVRVCVRTCLRVVWLPSGIGSQKRLLPFCLFPLWPAELSLFPVGGDELSLFPSLHLPNFLSHFSWAY